MQYVDESKFNLLLKKVEGIEKKVSSINGTPLIQAYSSKRFVLNEHLDVISLKKKLEDINNLIEQISETIEVLESKNPFYLTDYCKITAYLENDDITHPGIKIELSKDNGKTWEPPTFDQVL